jgi:hypothetical protein
MFMKKIRINHTATNKIDWDSLICVTSEKKPVGENRVSFAEFQYEQDDRQENLWTNFRKLIQNKHFNIEYLNKQSTFKRNVTSVFEPIVLTSYDSLTYSASQRNSYSTTEPTMLENCQSSSFSNNDSLNYKYFVSLDDDQQLPQASDA